MALGTGLNTKLKTFSSAPAQLIHGTMETNELALLQQCPKCFSELKYRDGMFWLYGTQERWEIATPFCPTCEPEQLEPPALQ
jgi:hypothetical protein